MKNYVIASLLGLFTVCLSHSNDLVITKEYLNFLKSRVSWVVTEYEDSPLKGWTFSDLKETGLGIRLDATHIYDATLTLSDDTDLPHDFPNEIDWSRSNCIYEANTWGMCSWPMSTVSMLSERCCISGTDFGLLSIQEIVSCDTKSDGCDGGWPSWALEYVRTAGGLVPESCFPWKRMYFPCPSKCADKSSWGRAHVCRCEGGYKSAIGSKQMLTALLSGPIVATFGACRSFMAYRSGIYHCDCGADYVFLFPAEIVGYAADPECNFLGKGPWGQLWGERGYFRIGCNECGIDGLYPKGNVYCLSVKK